jgi:Ca2+-binding RTX toxin-like protein
MWKKTALALTVGGGLFGGIVAQASAATVTRPIDPATGRVATHRLQFSGTGEEVNGVSLTVTSGGGTITFHDQSATITPDAASGCTASPDGHTVDCPNPAAPAATNVTGITIRLGGGNDTVNGDGTTIPLRIFGEGGRDTIHGGAGNDEIFTFGGAVDAIACGDGVDTVKSDAQDSFLDASCENVNRPATGGQGEAPPPSTTGSGPTPVLTPTAPGTPSPIKVKGCPTQFIGGSGNDRIDGTGNGDRMFGMGGNDILNGLGGADCLYGMAGNDGLYGGDGTDRLIGGKGKDLLSGGKGRDRLSGGSSRDRLLGGSGNDRLLGGKGNDRLTGGSGKNRYSGGAGNDRIFAHNGKVDTINCGSGRDVARVDRADKVSGCERVIR